MKVIAGLALVVLMCILGSGFTFPFLWLAWNHGVRHAFSFTNEITFFQAFWFDLGIMLIATSAKGADVEVKE